MSIIFFRIQFRGSRSYCALVSVIKPKANSKMNRATIVLILRNSHSWHVHITDHEIFGCPSVTATVNTPLRAGLRHVGASGRLTLWLPYNWYSLNFLGLRESWRTFLRVLAQTADNLQRNYFACGNLSLLIWHFRLFQWRLSTPYGLEPPRAAARLVSPFVRPWFLCEHELAWHNIIMGFWTFLHVM